MNIERFENHAIIRDYEAGVVFVYEKEEPRDLNLIRPLDKFNWDEEAYSISDGFDILPYGNTNDLPTIIKNVLFENYMAPGLLNQKTQLLWGQGPKLYAGEKFIQDSNGNINLVRDWIDDSEVQSWLDSWDSQKYLISQCVDFNYIQGSFTKYIRNRGARIGNKGFINELEHIPIDRARLLRKRLSENKKATHAMVSNHSLTSSKGASEYRIYNLFNFKNPFAYSNSIHYSSLYSFCMDSYTLPAIYGALEWVRRSTSVPMVIKALSDNSLNIKYHITSPQAFWDAKEKQLKEECESQNIEYKSEMLAEYETKLFRKITKVLGGAENVGKIWHTKEILEIVGATPYVHGWKITPIEQNIKDFVESNLNISKRSDYAVSTAIGLPPAIANISDAGKANGGSEQVYALQGYLLSGINIPEMITTEAINYAIAANFPNKKIKLGYFHKVAQKQSDINPQSRIKEIDPL